MMAFFNGKKKSRILLVAILVITLMATYALPMTVFAGDLPLDQEQQLDPPADPGATSGGGADDDSTGGSTDDDSTGGGTDDDSTGGSADDDSTGGGTDDDSTGGSADDETTGGGIEDEGMRIEGFESFMAPMLASIIPNSGDGIAPIAITSNPNDGDEPIDLGQYSKFKVGSQNDGTYYNNDGFSVELDFNRADDEVNWESNSLVKYVVVKGQGSDHLNLYTYNNDNGDTGLMAALDNQGNISKINYIEFYYATPYEISLEKTASVEEAVRGEQINYTFVVTNTGAKALRNVVLNDDKLNKQWNIGDLASGAGYTTTAAYTIPDDGDNGYELVNTAKVTGEYGKKGKVDATAKATVDVKAKYGITLEKTASVTEAIMGDQITYTFVVTNTGTGDLTNVVLNDNRLNKEWNIGNLASGTVYTTTAAYTVPDTGNRSYDLKNTATVEAEHPYWHSVNYGPNKPGYWDTKTIYATGKATVKIKSLPWYEIKLVKTASVNTAVPGDIVTYSFNVTNTGYCAFEKILLTDSQIGYSDAKNLHLARGAQTTFTKAYTIPENANFPYVNNATAEGQVWEGFLIWGDWETKATATGKFTLEETIIPEEPTPAETVKFFVRTNGPRPTDQGSQPESNFTTVLETIYITDPAIIGLSPGDSHVNEFPTDELGSPDPAVENAVKNWTGYDSSSYTSLISSIMTQLQSETYNTFLEQFADQDWHIDWYDLKWENDGWHVDGDIVVEQGEEEPEESIGDYRIEYLVSGSGITVAPSVTASTTASIVIIPAPARISGFETYVVTGKEGYAIVGDDGTVTITYSAEHEGTYNITVWYEAATVVPETPSTPRDRDRTITVADDEIPAAPITPAAIDGEQIVLNDAVPAGPLPKTGGIPSLLLYGLGALLAGGGGALKLRNKKNSEEK